MRKLSRQALNTAEAIAFTADRISAQLKGPRWLLKEYIDDVALEVQRAMDFATQDLRKELAEKNKEIRRLKSRRKL